jgi:hypothetical protein
MPLQEGGEWRACPGCETKKGHQEGYLMYPLTEEGQAYNIQLGKVLQRERRRRAGGGGGTSKVRRRGGVNAGSVVILLTTTISKLLLQRSGDKIWEDHEEISW